MSDMPPGRPLRPPPRQPTPGGQPSFPSSQSSGGWAAPPSSPPRRVPPPVPARPGAPPADSSSSGMNASSRRPGLLPSGAGGSSGFSSYLGSTSAFASKAKSAFFSAGSYVATTASTVAAVASAQTSGERRTAWEDWARDWRDGKRASISGKETIHVLPGWAAKKPGKDDPKGESETGLTTCSRRRQPLTSASRRLDTAPLLGIPRALREHRGRSWALPNVRHGAVLLC